MLTIETAPLNINRLAVDNNIKEYTTCYTMGLRCKYVPLTDDCDPYAVFSKVVHQDNITGIYVAYTYRDIDSQELRLFIRVTSNLHLTNIPLNSTVLPIQYH